MLLACRACQALILGRPRKSKEGQDVCGLIAHHILGLRAGTTRDAPTNSDNPLNPYYHRTLAS